MDEVEETAMYTVHGLHIKEEAPSAAHFSSAPTPRSCERTWNSRGALLKWNLNRETCWTLKICAFNFISYFSIFILHTEHHSRATEFTSQEWYISNQNKELFEFLRKSSKLLVQLPLMPLLHITRTRWGLREWGKFLRNKIEERNGENDDILVLFIHSHVRLSFIIFAFSLFFPELFS